MQESRKSRNFNLALLIFLPILIASFYPSKTALEGDQRVYNDISEKTNNWGFLTTFLYGEWPDFFGQWRFTLILFQLFISVFGFALLTFDCKPRTLKSRLAYATLYFMSCMYSIQLTRDSSLYAFTLFGLGLLHISFRKLAPLTLIARVSALIIIFVASMFKLVLSLALIPIVFWIIWQNKEMIFRIKKIYVAVFVILYSAGPYLTNSYLIESSKMQNVYPEQQPILLDLSMNYCWGQSESIRTSTKIALRKVIKPGYPIESICSATNPLRWDDLHDDPKVWQYSSPVIRIIGDEDTLMKNLLSDWISIIAKHPFDWLQVRLLLVGPALFMSNSFVNNTNEKSEAEFKVTDITWTSFMTFANLLDKLRLTSIFFALFLSFLLLYLLLLRPSPGRNWYQGNLLFSLLVLKVALALAILSFLAPNGRYVLTYVLLNFLLLYRAFNIDKTLKV